MFAFTKQVALTMLTGLFNKHFRDQFHLQWSLLFKDYKIHLTLLFKTFQDGKKSNFFRQFHKAFTNPHKPHGETELTSHKPLQEHREACGILGL